MPDIIPLSSQQWRDLHGALLSGYTTEEELRRLITFRLDPALSAEVGGKDMASLAFRLIEVAESRGLVSNLVRGMRNTRPDNPDIQRVAECLKLGPATVMLDLEKEPERVSAGDLERWVNASIPMLPSRDWRGIFGEIEGRVCRVEVGKELGSGFLIGPGTVLTAYHVVRTAHEGRFPPTNVTVRFDVHSRLSDQGNPYRLASDWLLHHATPSPHEVSLKNPNLDPLDTELDYAVLALDGRPGAAQIGDGGSPLDPDRGWISLPRKPVILAEDDPVMILGHPDGEEMRLSIDTAGFIGSDSTKNRIRYRTNTKGGSSGSPVFDLRWSLAALHHLGGPKVSKGGYAKYNQAIPIGRIVESLQHVDLLDSVSPAG